MFSFVANTLVPLVWSSLIRVVAAGLVGLCLRIGALWFFRRTDAAIMKERINKGSDRFFKDQKEEERAYIIAGGQRPAERDDLSITPTRGKRRPTESLQ
jgi:hypothetical protein